MMKREGSCLEKKFFWLASMAMVIFFAFTACTEKKEAGQVSAEKMKEPEAGLTITITYDNNPYDPRLSQAWGFSCVVRLRGQTILFDTGGDGSILLHNMRELGIDPEEIDVVMLSHMHGDHIGGLADFLQRNNRVTIYMPVSFPQSLKDEIRRSGARIREVDEAAELFENVLTTGELDGGIKEQSLVVRTPRGLVVITGCAHPGVVNIVRKAKEIAKDRVHLLLGGFHLGGTSIANIESIIENLVALGVEKVAPCHCSGDQARTLFKERFGANYIECGVGSRISITW
jgi:7,8-dihydropterin-6-yl-methyl-4-(beta-D-ribofuranosyl)aminobenzene 5'-phosphate synthase